MDKEKEILKNLFNKQIEESSGLLETKDKKESSCLLLLQSNMNSIQGNY